MATPIYVRQGEQLVRMEEEPYSAEDVLQELLENHPELLAGDEGPDGHRWMLIDREVNLASDVVDASRLPIDHLFVDSEGIPTFVEVKRSSDTRIRREVVGQMLDYAANAVVSSRLDQLRSLFEAGCARRQLDPEQILADVIGDSQADEYWDLVRTNVAAGNLRLVFVADEIPSELKRIVEFLNEQMTSTEVIAIEIKQYADADGQHQTLVPRLVGQTEAARASKSKGASRTWDRASILSELETRHGSSIAQVAGRIFDWATDHGDLRLAYGQGKKDGSFQAGLDSPDAYLFPFVLYTYGSVEVQFQWMRRRKPFDDIAVRRKLGAMLVAIDGVGLPEGALDKRPNIPLSALETQHGMQIFLDAMDWAFSEVQRVGRT